MAREYPRLNSSLTEDWERRTVRFHPAHFLDHLAYLNRYVKVPHRRRGPWSKRVISGLVGRSVVAHHHLPSLAPSEHKHRHISPFLANRASDTGSDSARSQIQQPRDMRYS